MNFQKILKKHDIVNSFYTKYGTHDQPTFYVNVINDRKQIFETQMMQTTGPYWTFQSQNNTSIKAIRQFIFPLPLASSGIDPLAWTNAIFKTWQIGCAD